MRGLLVVILAASILLLPAMALAEGTEEVVEEITEVVETKEEIEVLKLPYGVSIGLMPDERLPVVWYRTFDFDISQDLNTKIMRSYIGFSTGNFITDFTIGFSKEFEGVENTPDFVEDQGTANFSFTWNF